jgi:HEPN domain-containing protein
LIKGWLVGDGRSFPYSHNIRELANYILPHRPDLESLLQELKKVTVWGTAYRYPFEEESEPPPTAKEILSVIDKITELHTRLKASK